MLRLDFSDIRKNGYRITKLRLIHSSEMQPPKYFITLKKYELLGDIIQEKNHIMQFLIEETEIDFSIYILSLIFMFFFIIVALLSLVLLRSGLFVTIISGLLSLIFFLVARRFKEVLILGNISIEVSEDIYNSKVKEKYNF
jgi:hypothetical protein